MVIASLQAMHEKEPSDMTSSWYRFLALGLALVHLGKQEGASLTKEALNVVAEPLRTFAITLLDVCAYTGECIAQQSTRTFSRSVGRAFVQLVYNAK